MDNMGEEITMPLSEASSLYDQRSRLQEAALILYKQSGKSEDLNQVVVHCRELVTLCPIGHPDRSASFTKLGNILNIRYNLSGNIVDIEEAIAFHRQALDLRPPGHPLRSSSLDNLGNAIGDRYDKLGDMEDLKEYISYQWKALDLRPPGHPLRSASLTNFAIAVNYRYKLLRGTEDLEEVITHHREALSLRPLDHPNRLDSLINLANSVGDRYKQSGKIEDLEEIITLHRESLNYWGPGHPGRSSCLNTLGNAIGDRYEKLGRTEDLEEYIRHHREALALRPLGHTFRYSSLNNLAIAVDYRYKQLNKIEDLEEIIILQREALALCPLGHPDLSSCLNNLANSLSNHYKQLGIFDDLEEAITHRHRILPLCPPGHPLHYYCLDNLGNALSNRYHQLGRTEDLEQAISYLRRALAVHPLGHPSHSSSANNLAIAIHDRYMQLGRIEDIEEVITYHQQALAVRPRDHLDHSSSLNNLGNAVCDRYRQSGEIEDLDLAIAYHSGALSFRPLGHSDRSATLNNLGVAIWYRYTKLGRTDDLEAAIARLDEALNLRPFGHPDRPASLNNCAISISDRYKKFRRVEDLNKAITYHRKALAIYPFDHPARSTCFLGLTTALLTRYNHSHRTKDIRKALQLAQQAANHPAASLKTRLFAAHRWASIARSHRRHSSAVSAYSMYFRLLDQSLISYPSIDSQQEFLATADISVASDAASAAIDAEQLEAAVESLEQGRGLLWAKMHDYRHPLEELRQADRELADQLENISTDLERLALTSRSEPLNMDRPTTQAHLEVQMQQLRILSEEWKDAVRRVRNMEGFSNFLQAIPFSTLREAAAEGPIIIINVSKYRSDAIILLIDEPPVLVTLPSVRPEGLTKLSSRLATARDGRTFNKPSIGIYPILRELWKDIVCPVVVRLEQLGVAKKSRIWWCPTSELCGLPLHAAGPYRTQQKNLPDLYTSSYIATLSALIKSRSDLTRQSLVPTILVIGQPDESLQQVLPEIDQIKQLANFVNVMLGAKASHDTVLDGLKQHSWAHFACHGSLGKKAGPYQAAFQLHAGARLTLRELIQARLPDAQLAFLSACHSAAADLSTPNEAISLAAALQFCGFRSVIGTLWAMDDAIGPAISREFYKYMFRNPQKVDFKDSAEALNVAIRALRKQGEPLDRWIMFVHIGA